MKLAYLLPLILNTNDIGQYRNKCRQTTFEWEHNNLKPISKNNCELIYFYWQEINPDSNHFSYNFNDPNIFFYRWSLYKNNIHCLIAIEIDKMSKKIFIKSIFHNPLYHKYDLNQLYYDIYNYKDFQNYTIFIIKDFIEMN